MTEAAIFRSFSALVIQRKRRGRACLVPLLIPRPIRRQLPLRSDQKAISGTRQISSLRSSATLRLVYSQLLTFLAFAFLEQLLNRRQVFGRGAPSPVFAFHNVFKRPQIFQQWR